MSITVQQYRRSACTIVAMLALLVVAMPVAAQANPAPAAAAEHKHKAKHHKHKAKHHKHKASHKKHAVKAKHPSATAPVPPASQPQGAPQTEPAATPATETPQAAVQNVDVYSVGVTPGGIQSRQFKGCARPFTWNDGLQYFYCNYFTESSLGAGFNDSDWLYWNGSQWIRYQVVRCDATDATNCWNNGPNPSFNGDNPSPY